MARVGIVGLGKMGTAFALDLLSRHDEVHVYNRSKERLRDVVERGAISHPSPYELGKAVDIALTSLPNQDVVEIVATGKDGFLSGLRKGSLWIEASTIDPEASANQAMEAAKIGLDRLDCPVIGNPEMLAQGRVSLLIGGDSRVFEKYRDFLNKSDLR